MECVLIDRVSFDGEARYTGDDRMGSRSGKEDDEYL